MEIGNVAEWAQAVFGSGATVIALLALRAERQDRKAAESRSSVDRMTESLKRASRVQVELIPRTARQLEDRGHEVPRGIPAILTVRVTNTGDDPVENVTVRVPRRRQILHDGGEGIGVSPQGMFTRGG